MSELKREAVFPGLQVKHLTVKYDNGFQAVKDCSFQVEPGEIVALVGPNGCGKSSMLKAVAQLISHKGEVSIGAQQLSKLSRKERVALLSYVPQIAEMDVDLTAREIVRLGATAGRGLFAKAKAGDEARVTHALQHVSMLDREHSRWTELSGGQRQRLSIARALAQESQVIMLDEPTNHLDIEHQMLLVKLLRHVVSDHKSSAVIVLHDLGLAARMADKIVVMNAGEIKTFGEPVNALRPEIIENYFRVKGHIVHSAAGAAALMIEDQAE
ncbi:ABC transporter ATP-binding protein [Corynebacterium caspium]|uniref:ABC transporter ATP-binding protein n=1 Tax=Corynebacterium caspium TaxID=234828 RepID=UPI000377B3E1|nr:ABC transporter ATP-binding protein [Corynebacterium caspium]WKD58619.1 putative siderophore transport system ATP-binding protein YusV [Corynebacterium caspium DSM 44850]